MQRVIVVGGGVAGMSAAHELMERGLKVTLVERRPALLGGKARSFDAPGTATAGRRGLPAEHGFRFFPSSYRHLDDQMRRIPYRGQARGVLDNLVSAECAIMARIGQPWFETPARTPRSLADLRRLLRVPRSFRRQGLTGGDLRHFAGKILRVLTSCRARRLAELEPITWWDFLEADTRSPIYREVFATAQSQNMVSIKAKRVAASTIGMMVGQLLVAMNTPGQSADRVLCGPTSEVWIDPWRDHLRAGGVEIVMGATVTRLRVDAGRRAVVGVTLERRDAAGPEELDADAVICALNVEAAAALVDDPAILALDPALGGLTQLAALTRRSGWMTGAQFYLRAPLNLVVGHINATDTPWGLAAIPQEATWPTIDLSRRGDGKVRGVLSVDICDLFAPGLADGPARGRRAFDCTRAEILEEVWEQLRRALNTRGALLGDYHHAYLDASLRETPGGLVNDEPLFVSAAGTWHRRPAAATAISGLSLAGEHVQTFTDCASMEAVNESARRAVNAVLERLDPQRTLARCRIFDPDEALPLRRLRRVDAARFSRGEPWRPPHKNLLQALRIRG